MNRRHFLGTLAAAGLYRPRHLAAAPFPVQYRKNSPYELLANFFPPGSDDFPGEKTAMEIADILRRLPTGGTLPLPPAFRAPSPLPARYRQIAIDTFEAEYSPDAVDFDQAMEMWLASLGKVRASRFYVLANDTIRFEVQSAQPDGLEYRTGLWRQKWRDGKLVEFEPLRETLTKSARPFFRDATAFLFGACDSYRDQLLHGSPYWRARLDSATGIDIYGNNGIAAGDIDGDDLDEIYVCQPGGLPNRLYHLRDGRMEDITEQAGVGLLDDTASALFLDLRNTGLQDLVVLRASGPVLFLNQGDGRFTLRRDAFQFRTPPQGSFTGMAAADYDRDGHLDLYLCTSTWFQSEDQYRYPSPYHDARNGPPNCLFRNRLNADGSGVFEDVTASTGISANNNRFSFAPAWCDFNGDGWPDLYVANDFGQNNLYLNKEGRFEDIAAKAYVEDNAPGKSASWFDYDGDGRPDLYISNRWTEAGQRVVREPAFQPVSESGLREPYRRQTKGNSLYRNLGDGSFADVSEDQGVEMGRWAWGSDAHDFDNDGSPEIYVTCGMLTGPLPTDLTSFFWRQVAAKSPAAGQRSEAYERGWNAIHQFVREDYSWNGHEPNVLYARRNGRYHDFSGVSGLDCALDSRAFAVTDWDNDGRLDLIVKSRLGPQIKAFQNDCAGRNRSIAFRLVGTRSNRDAIGARVEVDGQVKFVNAGSGYCSQHTKLVYFGLGSGDEARSLRIWWPSGARTELQRLSAGYCYVITEERTTLRRRAFGKTSRSAPAADPAADNRPRAHDVWLLDPVPLPDRRKGPGLLYLGEGESPGVTDNIEVVNLRKEHPDVAGAYTVFRRYLLDWRTSLTLPWALLIDEANRVHKLYAAPPDAETLASDLQRMRDPDRHKLALPFAGDYLDLPRRNYFDLGAAFYRAGYPEVALPYLEEAVVHASGNGKALNAIGQIHLEAGRLEAARPYLEKAVAVNPRLGEAWNNLGGLESASGKLPAALAHYRRAVELLPLAAYPLVNAGEIEAEMGDVAAAVAFLRRAMEVDPKDAEAPNRLGMLAGKASHTAEARQWFQKAIELQRDHAGAINNLGLLYLETGQADNAIATFEYGITVAPREEVLYLGLGRVYTSLGDRAKTRETFERLLREKPDSTAAANALRDLEIP